MLVDPVLEPLLESLKTMCPCLEPIKSSGGEGRDSSTVQHIWRKLKQIRLTHRLQQALEGVQLERR